MSAPSAGVWAVHAIGDALVLVALGAAAGLVGVMTQPWVAGLLGGVGVCVGGSIWAVPRIGGAGLAAASIGLITSIGVSMEGHHALVASTAVVVEREALSSWDPSGDEIALHTRPLVHLRDQETWTTWTEGMGRRRDTITEIVTPVFDPVDGQVVGFHFRGPQGPRRADGQWLLSSAAWSATGPDACARGVAAALDKCAASGVKVAPGSEARLVEVFPSEEALRGAADLRAMWAVPSAFFLVYAVLVVLFRERGWRLA